MSEFGDFMARKWGNNEYDYTPKDRWDKLDTKEEVTNTEIINSNKEDTKVDLKNL